MVKVVLKNLTKRFGEATAVDNLNMEINDKDFIVLLGPSGCGKTTTLNMIAGLLMPDQGQIMFDDAVVNAIPPDKRDIAMVFQSYALYPHLSVFDNIAFPLKNRRMAKNEIQKRVKQTAEILRIEDLLKRRPSQLSGGQRQRVALGRAIVRQPRVFLLDEPLSNLDAKLRVHMRAELKSLQKELSVTTVYVTHDQLEATTMSDRIALMNKGILQQYATPEETYDHPANIFVADFVGTPPINLFECSYNEKDGKALLDASDFTIDVTALRNEIESGKTSDELMMGIRPEDFATSKAKPNKDAIQAEVLVVEPIGREMIVDFKVGGKLYRARTAFSKIEHREKLWFEFDRKNLHIFDRKTEKIIV